MIANRKPTPQNRMIIPLRLLALWISRHLKYLVSISHRKIPWWIVILIMAQMYCRCALIIVRRYDWCNAYPSQSAIILPYSWSRFFHPQARIWTRRCCYCWWKSSNIPNCRMDSYHICPHQPFFSWSHLFDTPSTRVSAECIRLDFSIRPNDLLAVCTYYLQNLKTALECSDSSLQGGTIEDWWNHRKYLQPAVQNVGIKREIQDVWKNFWSGKGKEMDRVNRFCRLGKQNMATWVGHCKTVHSSFC